VNEQVNVDEVWRAIRETDRQMQETDRFLKARFAETDRRLRELGQQIGGLGNRLGDFVEGVLGPGIVRVFRERGIEVTQTLRDLSPPKGHAQAQIDILAVDGDLAIAIEVKTKLRTEDVDEHLERLASFKPLFPRYSDVRLLGAVAAMVIGDKEAQYAERHGLFVIGQSGEDAVILNEVGFEPRAW